MEKEEADSAEIADSVANILTTLEDNPGDELTDTGNEMSQVTLTRISVCAILSN